MNTKLTKTENRPDTVVTRCRRARLVKQRKSIWNYEKQWKKRGKYGRIKA